MTWLMVMQLKTLIFPLVLKIKIHGLPEASILQFCEARCLELVHR